MIRSLFIGGLCALTLGLPFGSASAFCGFYVGKADTGLFNDASKVVLVRDGTSTTITMANDYAGEASEFAMVIPVPNVPAEDDIRVTRSSLIEHLDAYTAPRVVEYFDRDPCSPEPMFRTMAAPMAAMDMVQKNAENLGVTIEAEYEVGEYDILILSAKQSNGLLTWLNQEGYKTPEKAKSVLKDYIANGMKFFVAKVNLARQKPESGGFLSPLQIRMKSKKLMLPIRLGTVNARGDQELFVFAITRKGKVVGANYPTVNIPSDTNIPPFVENQFGRFYKDMFAKEVQQTPAPVMFTEYAWDMSWCDPCAANPPSHKDLIELGLDWLAPKPKTPKPETRGSSDNTGGVQIPLVKPKIMPVPPRMPPQSVNAFITRLHIRYNEQTFPNDLEFRVTDDRQNFQGRYVMQQPYLGEMNCPAAESYKANLKSRQMNEAINLAKLTGWSMPYILGQQQAYPGKPKK
ncbi:MAG: DUF2330 domain-containing protein [Alphaproteobacteria bacterium]